MIARPAMDDFLVFDSIRKSFGALRAVDEVSVAIRKGEVFSLLGPSGCGKTTLLRLAAGFEAPDSGRILLDGQDITALPPERRPVNTVFQNYALFPHLSVWENIAFGLRVARKDKGEIGRRVGEMLALIRLKDHARKKPGQLSGGQKQRVAIARALINQPRVLLLDEPLAALDLKLRQHMLAELRRLHDETGVTFVFVTHDQTEAMGLSDRVAVMNAGRIEQLGAPHELYEKPRTHFVASFIGDGNFLRGTFEAKAGRSTHVVNIAGLAHVPVPNSPDLPNGTEVEVLIRPEHLRIDDVPPNPQSAEVSLAGVIEETIYLGSATRWIANSGGMRFIVEQAAAPAVLRSLAKGSRVWLHFQPADVLVLPASEGKI
jgi:spermidine/putrescine transport system ATP-binding protein